MISFLHKLVYMPVGVWITAGILSLSFDWIFFQIVVQCFVLFVLIILYSLYLQYDSPLLPSASGLAG